MSRICSALSEFSKPAGMGEISEMVRCLICLRTGVWPRRAHDVEEVDVDELKKMVHAEDVPTRPGERYTEGEPANLADPSRPQGRRGENR